MKTNKKKILIISLITTMIIAIILVCILVPIFRSKTPKEIFNLAKNYVVEIKSQNEENFTSYGTAELINANGEFVTNAHVVTYKQLGEVKRFNAYYIRFVFEKEYREVELVRYDSALDLAFLKIKGNLPFKLKPAKTASSSKLSAGDKVYAVGNSQNFGISIAQGLIGIPLVEIEYLEHNRKVIQCDITIAEGNSGGALLDRRGRLIGITTFRTKDNKGNVIYGIAYCIPMDIVAEFLKQ